MPSDTSTLRNRLWTPGKLHLTESSSKRRGLPRPPVPPAHTSRRNVALSTQEANKTLLQAACSLARHGDAFPPTDCPIHLQDPCHHLLQALRRAEEVYSLALEQKRFELMAKAQLFRGHAYKAMGMWDLTYEAYVRAASHREFAADTSEEGLEALTSLCGGLRSGRTPLVHVNEVTGAEQRGNHVVRGLFRCGTFGDIGARGRDDASMPSMQMTGAAQQEELAAKEWDNMELGEDRKENLHGGDLPTGKGRNEDVQGDDHEDEGDEESEIDWIAIGSCKTSIDDSPGPTLYTRSEYPPLRSARGRLVPRKKLWARYTVMT